ncbi:N-6 DNA methylase [Listeria seeligeri]|uniref:HsdM family class I SAM-dependent methyltransferase n=1 Tax=Listeria seeligeri TaxID=1640 RepID=UPI001886F852|nr:N-6 DNA methylase [Listeria seeligeri]MBF2420578.1 N-6 DNA methylase [Listeria seeligeri]MBF2474327.1 N-6 DNA methylase [Listeria seeligeri]
MMNEKTVTDQYVRREIENLGISYEEQTSSNPEIRKALKGASKQNGKGIGKPEFIFTSNEHLIIIEDKLDSGKLIAPEKGAIDLKYPAINLFAVNGAVHYARHIVEKTVLYDEVIAIGISGNKEIQPVFVYREDNEIKIKKLNKVHNLSDFHPDSIEEWYGVNILGEFTKEQKEIFELQDVASELHEDLRNYGSLEGENKATVVSALLLALQDDTQDLCKSLQGRTGIESRDGDLIFNAINRYLQKVRPSINTEPWDEKIKILQNKFSFIKTNPYLNTPNNYLRCTPLKYFLLKLNDKVVNHFDKNTEFDILGHFYGEFVKYGGSDGNPLGIVLTPRHITSLMTELIDIRPEDKVLDPACGSGAFLISAMNRMLKKASSEEQKQNIKQNQLFGIELQEKLFTVATTNMILRGDGKSNLQLADMFTKTEEEMQKKQINKILFNPPYSQAKTKELSHLSELSFIHHALDMLVYGGKLAVIIPQSTMVGKTKKDKALKKEILEKHTLDYVITLNKNTFYGVGVNPCIAIFTAGKPHFKQKKVRFFNFEDDGYVVRKHIGLIPDGVLPEEKRKYLLDNINGDVYDIQNEFVVSSIVTAEDEWLHSYFYFNNEIPNEEVFEQVVADYLLFKLDMKLHGRGDMFED